MDIFNSKAIETGIVLAGVIMIFSLMVTATNEFIGRLINLRGRILRMFFLRFLGSKLTATITENPWITFRNGDSKLASFFNDRSRPSKVLPSDFSRAILSIVQVDSLARIVDWCNQNRLLLPPELPKMQFVVNWGNLSKLNHAITAIIQSKDISVQERELCAQVVLYPSLSSINEFEIVIQKYLPDFMQEWKLILMETIFEEQESFEFIEFYKKYRVAEGVDFQELKSSFKSSSVIVISKIPEPAQTYIRAIYNEVEGDLTQFQKGVEAWYELQIEKVSQWYQHRMIFISIGIGFVLAAMLNVNPIIITQEMWKNDEARLKAVAHFENDTVLHSLNELAVKLEAAKQLKQDSILPLEKSIKDLELKFKENPNDSTFRIAISVMQNRLDSFNTSFMNTTQAVSEEATSAFSKLKGETEIPLGWGSRKTQKIPWYIDFFGWFILGLLSSWGAPFWYEFLSKMIAARKMLNSGKT